MIIEGIFITLGVVFAICGLCELIHTIRLVTLGNSKNACMLSVAFLKPDSAVSQLSLAAEQRNWLGEDFARYIIGVTDAIGDEELSECRAVADEKGIILCDKEQLSRVASSLCMTV